MGYYVTLEESTFTLPTDELDEAYRRMCNLNERDDLKNGGSYSGGKMTAKWFSWMPENYPETCENADSIFRELGFQTEQSAEGLKLVGYDSKTGQEELFLQAVCDLAAADSRMYWIGEDGQRWMYEYGGERPVCYEATVNYLPLEDN